VALAEYNDVINTFPADRTDQSFSISILPRGARRRRSIADSYRSESANKDLTIGSVPITNEIAESLFPPAGAANLRRILKSYPDYYNSVGTYRSLHKDAPIFRPIQQIGIIRSHPILGGLHYGRI
jgi:hypothetical protein